MAGSFEHGIKFSRFIKGEEFLVQMGNTRFLKKDFALCSWLLKVIYHNGLFTNNYSLFSYIPVLYSLVEFVTSFLTNPRPIPDMHLVPCFKFNVRGCTESGKLVCISSANHL